MTDTDTRFQAEDEPVCHKTGLELLAEIEEANKRRLTFDQLNDLVDHLLNAEGPESLNTLTDQALTDQALEDRPDLFSPSDDISARKIAEAERDEALESLAVESEKVANLQRQLAERDAEPPPLSPDPVKHMIPDEIRKLMEDGESLSNAKRRLTELLWVEQAELRNLRGTDRGDLKREAEIERLLGLFARLGEI